MRVIIYEILNNFNEKVIGSGLRKVGKRLYQLGNQIQGDSLSEDRITPSLRRLAYEGKEPYLEQTSFVAPNATILGDVVVGTNSSVWYGATLLGTTPIRIGNNSIIQDRVHVSRNVVVGDNVFVGPNAILQGSTLESRAFVSMGATVRHATVQSGGFVAAGAVIGDNVEIKQGQIWAGNPGKFLRNITPLERQVLQEHLQQMHELATIHNEQTEKSTRQVINGSNYHEDGGANVEEYLKNIQQYPYAYTEDDAEFIEQRVLMKENIQFPEWGKDYEPYRYENKNVSEKFKIGLHEEQFAEVATRLKQKESFSDRKPWKNAF